MTQLDNFPVEINEGGTRGKGFRENILEKVMVEL